MRSAASVHGLARRFRFEERLGRAGYPTALRAGGAAPRFALPDHRGQSVSLDTLLRQGPVVVAFYRGQWCPYCNTRLHAYQFGITLSTEGAMRDLHAGVGADLTANNGDPSWRVPVPATYVIRPDGVIAADWIDGDFRHRAEPAEILAALDAMRTP